MKTRFPSILGVFAAILMVASFVIPVNMTAPSAVSADPGIMKWDTVSTPNAVVGKNDLINTHAIGANTGQGSEIIDYAVGNDGLTIAAIVRNWSPPTPTNTASAFPGFPTQYINMFYYSNSAGIAFTITRWTSLVRETNWPFANALAGVYTEAYARYFGADLFQVAIAPDDPKFIAVTSSCDWDINPARGPRLIWITTDAGQNWDLAYDGTGLADDETIRDLDISIDYGGKRDLGFVTTSAGGGQWFVRPSTGFTTWIPQLNADGTAAGLNAGTYYNAIKFSPTYNGDSSVALVYSDATATYFQVALRDLNANTTLDYAYGAPGVEVRNPSSAFGAGSSPSFAGLNNVDLELPSDFSGQSSSLRRAYISLDAYGFKAPNNEDGIYRVDDTIVYVLMDTSSTLTKSIYSIAYFGTYASGKLLAGERMGFPCTATVPTWFTDSPTTCPIPCWYPALKPTTGAANQGVCATGSQTGNGGAIVNWNADGSLGLVATGSLPWAVYAEPMIWMKAIEVYGTWATSVPGVANWWTPAYGTMIPFFTIGTGGTRDNDESAFAISRNNGETWNQLSLIDTTIDWFNDVAVAPDCTTIYLASVNRNLAINGQCNEFDSVWRATINPNVAAPLFAIPPIGTYWERVFTHVTSGNCNVTQTDLPILRVVESCTDKKDGEIVGWAAEDAYANTGSRGGVLAWSPDFGDYWAVVTPRDPVRDFVFETSTSIYTVSPGALVQKLPYTGTAWSTNLPSYDSQLSYGHTIAAVPDGKVLVGAGTGAAYAASYSSNAGVLFGVLALQLTNHGNEHVIFDVDFKNNQFMYMGDDNIYTTGLGTVYRNTLPSPTRWTDNDMMSIANGASGIDWPGFPQSPAYPGDPPHPVGIFGLVQAFTGASPMGSIPYGPALYAAHDQIITSPAYVNDILGDTPYNSAVCRTLVSRAGMPKPGIQWDCLDIFAPLSTTNVSFTLEPTSLKYCGCCTLDTNTTLYAIDDERGWTGATAATTTKRRVIAGDGRYNAGLAIPNQVAIGPNASGNGYTPNLNYGMLWAYTDCLAKKGPILKSPADKYLVGADPVTGRNQQIDLAWEQLCLSTGYELQIGKDANFTLRINPEISSAGHIAAVTGSIMLDMDSTNMTSPAAWIAPGALPEAGAIYYWRIRTYKSATSQLAWSPWSEARSFTVKAGFIVTTPYYGVQLLAPNNGCLGCKVKPASFSWSPWKEATKYQIDIAKDPEFKQLLVTATTTTTGYEYNGTLDYGTNYFWRVKALEVNGQNIPSDWSATFSFQTEGAPAPDAPAPAEPATPLWVWVIIAIGAILVIVTLILIFKTRRV